MSSDLTLAPRTAVELYCARGRIEVMFDLIKNLIKAFAFRFWSKYLPRHSRRPFPNRQLQAPALPHQQHVVACWHAYETFVMCAAIAQGLLQLLALQFHSQIWQQHRLYLRTQSRPLPSEKTVQQVFAPLLIQQLLKFPKNSILHKIRRVLPVADEDDELPQPSAA